MGQVVHGVGLDGGRSVRIIEDLRSLLTPILDKKKLRIDNTSDDERTYNDLIRNELNQRDVAEAGERVCYIVAATSSEYLFIVRSANNLPRIKRVLFATSRLDHIHQRTTSGVIECCRNC